MRTSKLVVLIAAISTFVGIPVGAYADEHGQKTILITGATTGIGRNLAESLAAEGHFVYAGARKQKDMDELNAIDNIMAVRLDVTSQEDIDAAVELIKSEGRGLYALVNNAGVYAGIEVIQTSMRDLDFVMGVNVDGVFRVTKAFAPLVIEEKGRIATTGSIAGIKSNPGGSAYSMSKHAMEAFADSLAGEMEPLGVKVSIVEPGSYKSHIRRTAVGRAMKEMNAAGVEPPEGMEEFAAATAERELSYKEPDDVTEAFKHALFAEEPHMRYMVVPNEEQQSETIDKQIRELVQLNQWGPYSYTRDELVEKLDKALAEN
ncbi:MAG: SDR family NAD(P)-dependent oxidoreductase [Woeseiaceae bacterium]|nr:SDR family NAD(P)-dependent oxidoreductase [Woeseiaceae bacterium]